MSEAVSLDARADRAVVPYLNQSPRAAISVSGKRNFGGQSGSAENCSLPVVGLSRDRAAAPATHQFMAYSPAAGKSPQARECVVGSAGLKPATKRL
jgi:hypothetical protein